MKRGLFLAPFNELSDPGAVADAANEAERRGWNGIFVWDHLQHLPPVDAVADPWIVMAAMACRTRTVRLGPMITPIARRRPWKVAREIITLDHLSRGRMILGLGVGGDQLGEMAGFGEQTDIRLRAKMLDEALELLDDIQAGKALDHHGEYYSVTARPMLPRPVQRPRVPVWIGGRWPNRGPMRRANRWDGYFPDGITSDELAETVHERRVGSTADGFELCVRDQPGADVGAWQRAGATWLLTDVGPYDGRMPTLELVRDIINEGP